MDARHAAVATVTGEGRDEDRVPAGDGLLDTTPAVPKAAHGDIPARRRPSTRTPDLMKVLSVTILVVVVAVACFAQVW